MSNGPTGNISRPQASNQADLDELARAFDRRYGRMNVQHNNGNGNNKFQNWMLATIMLLVAAGICGEVVVYGQVQKISGTVDLIVQGRIR